MRGRLREGGLLVDASAARRQQAARAWVIERRRCSPSGPLFVVAQQLGAASDLVHPLLLEPGTTVAEERDEAEVAQPAPCRGLFAVYRLTLDLWARDLCAGSMAARGLALAGGVTRQALVGRLLHLHAAALEHFAPVAETKGFARALSRTLDEMRLHEVEPAELEKLGPRGLELAALLGHYVEALAQERLLDRAGLLRLAAETLTAPAETASVLLFDIEIDSPIEADFVHRLVSLGWTVAATLPHGDRAAQDALGRSLTPLAGETASPTPVALGVSRAAVGLQRLQLRLFAIEEIAPVDSPEQLQVDDSVAVFSAPSAPNECLQIARQVLELTDEGVRAEDIAVLVRQASPYAELLDEALQRAGLGVYLAGGAFRPDPAGRAFVLLLRCAAEGLSATRFAEYLSLGQVPYEEESPAPGEDAAAATATTEEPEGGPRASGFVAPSRWERLIGDAAVVGGLDRWQRRLAGQRAELAQRREALDEPDGAVALALERDQKHLEKLSAFALPLLTLLDSLPAQATWGEWVERLITLAARSLARPQRVRGLLDQLHPLSDAGPVGLAAVVDTLAARLSDLRRPAPTHRYGRVYVGIAHEVRGRSFDTVFVAGLAERSFPQKVLQDSVLPDRLRAKLTAPDARRSSGPDAHEAGASTLPMATERREKERLALHLAVGAARRRLVLSYPRMDLVEGQPRVPSFYLLEALRAVRGRLPDLERLIEEAAKGVGYAGVDEVDVDPPAAGESERGSVVRRPAPPEVAIDQQEYDLLVLREAEWRRIHAVPGRGAGEAADLGGFSGHVHEYPFVIRALRARWMRRAWRSLSPCDGLLAKEAETLEWLAGQSLKRRAHAVTTLERYARCPYQFYLSGLLRLRPMQDLEPDGHQHVDPLTRGRLYHQVQFELFRALKDSGALPLRADRMGEALELLARTMRRVSEELAEKVAPAVPLLWQHETGRMQAELQSWLRREADKLDYTPRHFEYAFGLSRDRAENDDASPGDPAQVEGYLLRGAIDLVEEGADGRLRVTDYKSGRSPVAEIKGLGQGSSLQRVLYALAYEALNPGARVEEGRLYYCSERGGYREQAIVIDPGVRKAVHQVLASIDRAITSGFLPALPHSDCEGCDYRRVCGQDAAERSRRKQDDPRVAPLMWVREQ